MFMDHSPRKLIEMIRRDLRDAVLQSNTYWMCSSCYSCTVKCPAGIRITDLMYALKRYSIWKGRFKEGLIGPDFQKAFVKMILASGKAYEAGLAPFFVSKYSIAELVQNSRMGLGLWMKGRLPLTPKRIRRLKPFRKMVSRIIPVEA
jgi:heterodisulfide reductase subunit C